MWGFVQVPLILIPCDSDDVETADLASAQVFFGARLQTPDGDGGVGCKGVLARSATHKAQRTMSQ